MFSSKFDIQLTKANMINNYVLLIVLVLHRIGQEVLQFLTKATYMAVKLVALIIFCTN